MIKKTLHLLLILLCLSIYGLNAMEKPIEYLEQAFLDKYSGQSKEYVSKNLGKPHRVDISVKPINADQVLKEHDVNPSQVKKDIIEMWYYDAKINYAKDKYFNQAELTFVNNKCVNITLANKKRK